MAASPTVLHSLQDRNSPPVITPKHGVVTLFGYGISVRVKRGHLILEDGIGDERRSARFARVYNSLKRLVVIGSDGIVSFAALRWIADQGASFVMLERDGSVLATTGPVSPSDARLRRAQALAHHSGIALPIAKELIRQKLIGQEQLLSRHFPVSNAGPAFLQAHSGLENAKCSDEIRLWEAQAAKVYWRTWRDLPISFPRADFSRVPHHWKRFGSRISPLTSSPRLAVNPANAMLNYLYALLESEARLALAALGLDPGLGVLHNDLRTRDSLACDLMEPLRPKVDSFLLEWLNHSPVRREWFFEERNGNCRLMSSLASQLSETSNLWARALAPFAEGIAQSFWSMTSKQVKTKALATRLTQSRKREAKGKTLAKPVKSTLRPSTLCRICGKSINSSDRYCHGCVPTISRENLLEAAKLGRVATHSLGAEALRSATQQEHARARKLWDPKSLPTWLTEETYREKIRTRLPSITVHGIASALGVSEPYATDIRKGKRLPHPRHWQQLAALVGMTKDNQY